MSEQRFSLWHVAGLLAALLAVAGLALAGGVFLGYQWGRSAGLAAGLRAQPESRAPSQLPALPELPNPGGVFGWAGGGPVLGVRYEPITPDLAEAEGLPVEQGALIRAVQPGSPADAAGLEAGDIVQALDGEAVDEARSLRDLIEARAPGAEVRLSVLRAGESLELTATLGGGELLPGPQFFGPQGELPPGFHFEFRCSPEPCPFQPNLPGLPAQPES